MSKKTAIQELLEWCEYRRSKSVNSHLGAWNMIITKIKDEQLPIEKQQIENAVTYGNRQETYDGTETLGGRYYNETYKS